jgi:glycosyltransferase involved in cell wall biosynthesis
MTEITRNPAISCVLPTHNGSKYIDQSIQSVVDQTFTDWELIIVDDASSDDTLQKIRGWANREERIRIIALLENRKLPGALNEGFRVAAGKYFTWTSDDNLYRAAAFARMLAVVETCPEIDVVYTDYTNIDDQGTELSRRSIGPTSGLAAGNSIGASFLYRREVQEMLGGYAENLFLVEDYDFWLRASNRFRFEPLHEDLYLYRWHETSLTTQRASQIWLRHEELLASHLPHLKWLDNTARATAFLRLARLAKHNGRPAKRREYLIRAFQLVPTAVIRDRAQSFLAWLKRHPAVRPVIALARRVRNLLWRRNAGLPGSSPSPQAQESEPAKV